MGRELPPILCIYHTYIREKAERDAILAGHRPGYNRSEGGGL
jgi:hypothetical protein